jgi:N-acyl-D-aspartate/D-glutamate deacylase
MGRAILIILVVVAAIVGGLLVLRASARTGMPDEEVLKRAAQRARAARAAEDRER